MTSYDTPATEAPAIHIVGLGSSVSANSSTYKVLRLALDAVEGAGAQATMINLHTLRLPFAATQFAPHEFPDVGRLNDLVGSADALIWTTPEYHGSYSGVLKNALDLGGFDQYGGKAVALLGVAGGQIGAIQALGHLRGVARSLHMWCLPRQVSVAHSGTAFHEDGTLKDDKLTHAITELGREIVRLAPIIRAVGANE